MTRYKMLIDVDRCIGCHNCFLACRDEHAGNDHLPIAVAQPQSGRPWIKIREQECGPYPNVSVSRVPLPCLHCAEAACMKAATNDAVYRREDGIVIIDPEKAAGQRAIVSSCPYGVISWNEERNVPQKCTLCAHLLDAGWKQPRCVEACPTRALVFGGLDDADSDISKRVAELGVEDLHPEFGLKPLVGYIGLPTRFLVGEIVLADKAEQPAEGVQVSLLQNGRSRTTSTDGFGEFRFDGLDDDAECVLRVEHPQYRRRELTLKADAGVDIGAVVIDPVS